MENIRNYRMEKVLSLMTEKGLDGLLICNWAKGNLRGWLTACENMPGHVPFGRNGLIFVDKSGNISEYASREAHPCDYLHQRLLCETGFPEDFSEKKLGVVNMQYLKKINRDWLCGEYPGIELTDCGTDFYRLQMTKTEEEVSGVREAALIFERVFSAVPMLLMNEPTEREFAVKLRNCFRSQGAECEDLAGSCIVSLVSSKDGEMSEKGPFEYPGRRLRGGDRINLTVNGYVPGGFASALGRTYVVGKAAGKTRKLYDTALKAQKYMAKNAVPGATIAQIMKLVKKDIFAPQGLKMSASLQMYGIGAGLQEFPRNTDKSEDEPLKAGMTLVIAPVVQEEGCDAFSLADVFEITGNGAARLGKSDRNLIEIN